MEKFAIITPGRSGSTHLSETLNSHRDVHIGGELFNRSNEKTESFRSFLKLKRRYLILGHIFHREKLARLSQNFVLHFLIRKFLKHHFERQRTLSCGFKLTLDQLQAYPYVFDILTEQNFKFIYLTRRDQTKCVLSLIKARKTGQYHTTKEKNFPVKFTFDPREVVSNLRQLNTLESVALNRISGEKFLLIYYEDLFNQYSKTMQQIINFLGVDATYGLQSSNLKKLNSDDLTKWVRNFNEITEAIATHSKQIPKRD